MICLRNATCDIDIGALRIEIIVYCLPLEPKTMKNTCFQVAFHFQLVRSGRQ